MSAVRVEDIDAEIEPSALAAFEASLRQHASAAPAAKPSDDQATRLRSLFKDNTTSVQVLPEGLSSSSRLAPPPAPAPAPPVSPQPARAAAPVYAPPTPRSTTRAKVITIASGKGGVGKTNIAVNLSIALAQRGLKVTLVDADLGTANADLICGVTPAARLHHVLSPGGLDVQDGARRSIHDLAISAPGGFRLVPGSAGVSRMADLSAGERRALIQVLHELERDADIVIVDAAAGVGRSVTGFMLASDMNIIVTTPEPTALADAYALAKCAATGEAEGASLLHDQRLGVVINQCADPLEAFGVHARFAKVCKRFLGAEVPMLGFVAQDVHVAQAVRAQRPLLVRSPQSAAALNISELGATVADMLGVRSSEPAPAAQSRGLSALVRRLLGA